MVQLILNLNLKIMCLRIKYYILIITCEVHGERKAVAKRHKKAVKMEVKSEGTKEKDKRSLHEKLRDMRLNFLFEQNLSQFREKKKEKARQRNEALEERNIVIKQNNRSDDEDSVKSKNFFDMLTRNDLHRKDYMKHDDFFMAVAFLVAKRSKDPMAHAGACVVNEEKNIVGTGYNGVPKVWKKKYHGSKMGTPFQKKFLYACHAEINAIMNCSGENLQGCTMYVGRLPCAECARLITRSGMAEVVYVVAKDTGPGDGGETTSIFEEGGVRCRRHVPSSNRVLIDFMEVNWLTQCDMTHFSAADNRELIWGECGSEDEKAEVTRRKQKKI